jgi:hypothetical protein
MRRSATRRVGTLKLSRKLRRLGHRTCGVVQLATRHDTTRRTPELVCGCAHDIASRSETHCETLFPRLTPSREWELLVRRGSLCARTLQCRSQSVARREHFAAALRDTRARTSLRLLGVFSALARPRRELTCAACTGSGGVVRTVSRRSRITARAELPLQSRLAMRRFSSPRLACCESASRSLQVFAAHTKAYPCDKSVKV